MTTSSSRRVITIGMVILAVLVPGACSGSSDTDTDADGGRPGTVTSPASPTSAAGADAGADRSAEALAFFLGAQEACAGIEARRFQRAKVTGRRSAERYDIEDGLGTKLVVDLTQRIVTGPEGPDGALPREYTFDCAPGLFRGAKTR